jgi:NADPH-dependent 2,4-dienoyl-CoA reductase/sulfur reductase-like enzyme
VAIGSTPATDWLAGSGLTLQDGIACDAYCCAAPGVYAAGDVARWHHPLFGLDLRLEHRMNATEQGITAARNILDFAEPFAPIPFMWSNQYDERLQAFGIFPAGCEIEIDEIGSDGRKRTATFRKQGRLVGVLGWNAVKELRQLRQQLMPTPVAAN